MHALEVLLLVQIETITVVFQLHLFSLKTVQLFPLLLCEITKLCFLHAFWLLSSLRVLNILRIFLLKKFNMQKNSCYDHIISIYKCIPGAVTSEAVSPLNTSEYT